MQITASADEQPAGPGRTGPHLPYFDTPGAAKAVVMWLGLAPQPRSINDLLHAISAHIHPVPFNLIKGQWFLGTEALPNQSELDQLRAELGQVRAELREAKLAAAVGYEAGTLP